MKSLAKLEENTVGEERLHKVFSVAMPPSCLIVISINILQIPFLINTGKISMI